jgi:hypothetical protein
MDYALEQIFVTGGAPTVTYVRRDEASLEREVRRYLRSGNKVLAISGPSKSGKSVLVEKVLNEDGHRWIHLAGGSLDSMEAFWEKLAYRVSAIVSSQVATTSTEQGGVDFNVRLGSAGFPIGGAVGVAHRRGRSLRRLQGFRPRQFPKS